ncbi:hypothetical protein DFH27DRAFT_541655 [Peziza echinospora]|nr:hypothetical protein DFH27DRAFT_541655 [Peziza echinospora]
MAPKYHAGQRVEYRPIGGRDTNSPTSHGVIERVLTSDDTAGSTGVTVKASPENPRYEIKNDNTGKVSALNESNILSASDADE